MSATMEGMVGEKRIVPERSEWFRSSGLIGTAHGPVVLIVGYRQVGSVRFVHYCDSQKARNASNGLEVISR